MLAPNDHELGARDALGDLACHVRRHARRQTVLVEDNDE